MNISTTPIYNHKTNFQYNQVHKNNNYTNNYVSTAMNNSISFKAIDFLDYNRYALDGVKYNIYDHDKELTALAKKNAKENNSSSELLRQLLNSVHNYIYEDRYDCMYVTDHALEFVDKYLFNYNERSLLDQFTAENCTTYDCDELSKKAKKYYKEKKNIGFWSSPFSFDSEAFGIIASGLCKYVYEYRAELNRIKISELKEKEIKLNRQIITTRQLTNAKETITLEVLDKLLLAKTFQNDEEIKKLKLKNSIMIEHPSDTVRKDLLNWTLQNADCNKLIIDNNKNMPHAMFVRKLITALENCKNIYSEKVIPSLLYAEDFDKFLSDSIPKAQKGALKSLLQDCYKKYNTIIIFDTANSKVLDKTSIQPHRTLHIDIEHDPIIERIKNIQTGADFLPELDGYRMIYGANPDDNVELYLGCFGYNKEILWVNSNKTDKINVVLEKLDLIKRNAKFSEIKKIQCPAPNGIITGFVRLDDKTISGETIYEKRI